MTRYVFVFLLALADETGQIEATTTAIARRLNIDHADLESALSDLQTPDPRSGTPDEDGRRVIRHGTRLWQIVNYQKYRSIATREDRRRKDRERKRRQRSDPDESMVEKAGRVILDLIFDGPKPSSDVRDSVLSLGISERTYRRAKDALGVITKNESGVWMIHPPPTVHGQLVLGGVGHVDGQVDGRVPLLYGQNLGSISDSCPNLSEPVQKCPPSEADADADADEDHLVEVVDRVFDHWVKACDRDESRTRLTAKRRAKIKARLKDSTEEEIHAAIDACAASDFHMGANDRNRPYNDLADHILKSRDKLEEWLARPSVSKTNGTDADSVPWWMQERIEELERDGKI